MGKGDVSELVREQGLENVLAEIRRQEREHANGRNPDQRALAGADVPEAVLDEHATETQLARVLQSKLPPLRCVGEDWFVYRGGVWTRTSRHEFKPFALAIQNQRTRTARRAAEVLKHVEFANQINEKDFRSFHFQDPHSEIFINCANNVLAVSPKEVRVLPHCEHYMFKAQLAATYDPNAEAPEFETALQFSLRDPSDIELLRRFAGYILLPDCRHEVALVCYGEAATGKSTISSAIEAALGRGLVTQISLEQLSSSENKNLAKLADAALNLSTELDAIEVSSENFKRLVSGEPLEADRKYRDSISLSSSCKFWFNANHLPRFRSGTDAELRRLLFLRFDRKVQTRDETLKERIRAERDGVLITMLQGLRTLLSERTFPHPSLGSEETKDRFKLQNDPICVFVESECVLDAGSRIPKVQLYNAYKSFSDANGLPAYHEPQFFRELFARHNLKSVRSGSDSKRIQEIQGIDLC